MTKTTEMNAYFGEIAASIHEMMEGFAAAVVIEKQTMREFDADCLTSAEAVNTRASDQPGSSALRTKVAKA